MGANMEHHYSKRDLENLIEEGLEDHRDRYTEYWGDPFEEVLVEAVFHEWDKYYL